MISTVILTHNSEDKIKGAIDSVLDLSNEIIVLDGDSKDNTISIAREVGAKVIKQVEGGYSDWRNQGIRETKGDWIFYLDFDERVTPELKNEILQIVKGSPFSAFAIPRINIIFGKKMLHGGWWPDYVERLFKRDSNFKWQGDLHERPKFEGELGYTINPLIHLKHDTLSEMVEKTNKWSTVEGKLLFENNHPKMSWWRFIRVMATELIDRLFIKKGMVDGPEGIIYAFYQMWSKFSTYAKLAEMQSKHA